MADAEKYLRSRTKLLELLRKLLHIVGQRFSWNSLVDVFSGHTDSVDTIQKYFEYLGYSFIVANVFFVDISRKTVRPKKDKKLYTSDRIIAEKDTILKDGNIVGLPAWLFFSMLNEE